MLSATFPNSVQVAVALKQLEDALDGMIFKGKGYSLIWVFLLQSDALANASMESSDSPYVIYTVQDERRAHATNKLYLCYGYTGMRRQLHQ